VALHVLESNIDTYYLLIEGLWILLIHISQGGTLGIPIRVVENKDCLFIIINLA